jgi:23S rRNA pseudouridine2604 synthase
MARIILKVSKPVDPAARPKELTSRAQRVHGKAWTKGRPAEPAKPAPSPAPQATPAATSDEAAKSARSRRRRSKPSEAAGAERVAPAPSRDRRGGSQFTPSPGGKPQPAGVSPRRRATSGPAPAGGPSTRSREKFVPPARSATPTPQRAAPAPAVPRPIRHENPHDPRLSKRMTELGLCSRREADEWIENGWVKVNGEVVAVLGVRVSPHARIEVDPAAAKHQSELVTILLNKPIGYVSGQAEHGYEPAMVLVKPENRWADDPSPTKFKLSHMRGLAPAGRLDIDSTGLLVFTQDGRIAKHLIGRDSAVEKEYLVRVEGTLSDQGMKLLQHGLELDGVKLKPARVSWQNEDQLRFVLREGRKRQIRRMCELVGLVVTGLKRVRSGSVSLGPLPMGQWRYLRRDERF